MVLLYPTKVYPQVTTSRMNNMNVSILQNILVYNRFVLQESGDFTWRVSDCEELSLARVGIERPSHGFKLDSQTHY